MSLEATTLSQLDTDTELVLGLVSPVGVDLDIVQSVLEARLRAFGFTPVEIRLSKLLERWEYKTPLAHTPASERLNTHMSAGNELRERSGRGDFLALAAVNEIQKRRADLPRDQDAEEDEAPRRRVAYIIRSLKHPDEVATLRSVYGRGFFLIGVHDSRGNKLRHLREDRRIRLEDAQKIIQRDEAEGPDYGQRTRDTFHLADAFVSLSKPTHKAQLWRILDLLFGHPCETPTADEQAMFLAFSASLGSADLSRQVGAVVSTAAGDVVATGCNDVPRAGGGLYRTTTDEAEPLDWRDFRLGQDANALWRSKIADEIVAILKGKRPAALSEVSDEELRAMLAKSRLSDLTEFVRAVHAEMEALLSAARSGVSVRDGTLFCTTFPCHNCAKHLVAAGLKRVVYVEPYPKSLALQLHGDAIKVDDEVSEPRYKASAAVSFEPFVGIGPRRYVDLFSMNLGNGRPVKRKRKDGEALAWDISADAQPRLPLSRGSYIDREKLASILLDQVSLEQNEH